jgi:hypothetical protein
MLEVLEAGYETICAAIRKRFAPGAERDSVARLGTCRSVYVRSYESIRRQHIDVTWCAQNYVKQLPKTLQPRLRGAVLLSQRHRRFQVIGQ